MRRKNNSNVKSLPPIGYVFYNKKDNYKFKLYLHKKIKSLF